MQELIGSLVSQLGVSGEQAEGGIGLIAKLAQEKLGGADFSQLAESVPGLAEIAAKAPEASSGGLGGMLGSAVSALGGSDLGNLAELAGGFDKLGIDAGMISKFVPIVQEYLEGNGGDLAKTLIGKFL